MDLSLPAGLPFHRGLGIALRIGGFEGEKSIDDQWASCRCPINCRHNAPRSGNGANSFGRRQNFTLRDFREHFA